MQIISKNLNLPICHLQDRQKYYLGFFYKVRKLYKYKVTAQRQEMSSDLYKSQHRTLSHIAYQTNSKILFLFQKNMTPFLGANFLENLPP